VDICQCVIDIFREFLEAGGESIIDKSDKWLSQENFHDKGLFPLLMVGDREVTDSTVLWMLAQY
jgi:hypothetical protein